MVALEEETGRQEVVAPKDEAGREFAARDDIGGGRSWPSGRTGRAGAS